MPRKIYNKKNNINRYFRYLISRSNILLRSIDSHHAIGDKEKVLAEVVLIYHDIQTKLSSIADQNILTSLNIELEKIKTKANIARDNIELQRQSIEYQRELVRIEDKKIKTLAIDYSKTAKENIFSNLPILGVLFIIFKNKEFNIALYDIIAEASDAALSQVNLVKNITSKVYGLAEHIKPEQSVGFSHVTTLTVILSSLGIITSALGVILSAYRLKLSISKRKDINTLRQEILDGEDLRELKNISDNAVDSFEEALLGSDTVSSATFTNTKLRSLYLGEHFDPYKIAAKYKFNLKVSKFLYDKENYDHMSVSRTDAINILQAARYDLKKLGLKKLAIILGKLNPALEEDQLHIRIINATLNNLLQDADRLDNGTYSESIRQSLSGIMAQSAIKRAESKIKLAKTKQDLNIAVNTLYLVLSCAVFTFAMLAVFHVFTLPIVGTLVIVGLVVALSLLLNKTNNKKDKEDAVIAKNLALGIERKTHNEVTQNPTVGQINDFGFIDESTTFAQRTRELVMFHPYLLTDNATATANSINSESIELSESLENLKDLEDSEQGLFDNYTLIPAF